MIQHRLTAHRDKQEEDILSHQLLRKNSKPVQRKYVIKAGAETKQAFKNHLQSKFFSTQLIENNTLKPLTGIGEVLNKLKTIVKNSIIETRNSVGNLRFNIRMKVEIEKIFSTAEDNSMIKWLNSTNKDFLASNQFDHLYDLICNEIFNQYEEFSSYGSGYTINNIFGVSLDTYSFNPLKGGRYIPSPPQIR